MNKKYFLIIVLFSLLIISIYSSNCFAATGMANEAKNALMNTGNSIGNIVGSTKNTISNGTNTIGTDLSNGAKNIGTDIKSGINTTASTLNSNYTTTRTATNSNLLGMSDSAWTWLILGIVGIIIVALVWYYGAQYEHRNYNNNH